MTKPAATDRKTLRSPWMVVSWLLGFVVLFTGAATAAIGPSEGDWVGAAMGGILMFLPGAWVTFRVPFMRVALTASGLTNHGLFRNQTLAWADILSVEVADVDDKILATTYAPSLELRGQDDGRTLMQLAGYTTTKRVGRSRMTRQASLIEHRRTSMNHTPD
jgi:Bacterial PH domain